MSATENQVTLLKNLLALHDRAFVTAAYHAVLGRAPDAEGQAYHLDRLRAGVPKLTLLGQMRRSREGRAFTPAVTGLDAAIRRHWRANLPIFGFFVRLVTGTEGQGATHRQLRIVVNEIGRLQAECANFNGVAANSLDQAPVAMSVRTPSPVPASPATRPFSQPTASPPRLDPGSMAADMDSFERRLLGALRLSARNTGAQA